MNTNEESPEYAIARETKAKIIELFKDGAPMDMVYSMLQGVVDKCAKKKQYIILFKLDYANDYEVTIELSTTKPADWSSTYIRDFLKKIGDLLGENQVLVYSFTLRYQKPLLVEIGEVPDNRFSSYCFTKPNGKIKKVKAGKE